MTTEISVMYGSEKVNDNVTLKSSSKCITIFVKMKQSFKNSSYETGMCKCRIHGIKGCLCHRLICLLYKKVVQPSWREEVFCVRDTFL